MVYLDAYNPRERHLTGLGAHWPRRRYLTGLGAFHPRRRYLSGCGCGCGGGCGCGVQRMIGPLGDDIAPPNIGPDTSAPGSPGLFASTGGNISTLMLPPPPGTPYGPAVPVGMINTLPVTPPTPVAGAMGPAPAAPAISYGSAQAVEQMYASSLVRPGAAPASVPGTLLGIPTQYFVYGGLGLVGLTLLGSMKKGGRRR